MIASKPPPFSFSLKRSRSARGLVLILLCALVPAGLRAELPPLGVGWDMVTKLQFVRAIDHFSEIAETQPEQAREAHLGLGVSFLNRQPKTRGTIEAARENLQRVIDVNAGDDLGIRARYLLGRVEQIHRYEPDWEAAKAIYADLFTEHPEHLYAQLAKVRWATIHLYATGPHSDKRALLAEAQQLEDGLSHPVALRDYHLLMSGIYPNFDMDTAEDRAEIVRHLLAAQEAGIIKPGTRANVFVRIAENARLLEDYALAAEHYDLFLEEFRRDNRHGWVAERRQEIEKHLTDHEEPGKDS